MLTSLLIVLPLVGALVVWAAPLPREGTAALAVLVALAEVVLWVVIARRVRLRLTGAAGLRAARVVRRPRRHLHRRLLRLLALARGAHRRRRRGVDRLRRLGRPREGPRLLRADALPDRRRRRRLRRPGSPPLLRLLRGDADPDLRARRRLGRPEPDRGDGHVRHLHDGGLAADARVDRRLRALAGHVQPDRLGHERQRVGLPRLHDRVRGQGAAAAVPRLAADGVHRGPARGRRAALRRRLEGRRLRAGLDRAAALPGAGAELAHRRARARRRRPRLRLDPRVPAAGRARRHRVLVDGPDEPDRARDLRRRRPRPRRARSSTRSATGSSRQRCSCSPRC